MRRATVHYDNYNLHCVISIHALLAESDRCYPSLPACYAHFYPRSPCGERRKLVKTDTRKHFISIHALLAESDWTALNRLLRRFHFYPRSPCGERRSGCVQYYIRALISIHALLAESDRSADCNYRSGHPISIHALLAESDTPLTSRITRRQYFYPRSPCGERLSARQACLICRVISIHALLAESDLSMAAFRQALSPISIHALLAESDAVQIVIIVMDALFLSTLSLRRATTQKPKPTRQNQFLSTLSLRRATVANVINKISTIHFYPRSPCGERRQQPPGTTRTTYFYPRSPCGERHFSGSAWVQEFPISIHALLAESDFLPGRFV